MSASSATLAEANEAAEARAQAAIAALAASGDLDRLVSLARVLGGMSDAMSDDIVTRLSATAADGMDLLDRANRSGIARALPAIAALVENGDLDRLVGLARVLGGVSDAMSDDIVTRLSATAADGMDLLDRANRSGIARALPAIAALVENGDLDRLVALARVAGGVSDAMSDDIVTRLAETASNALVLIDRITRSGLADRLVALADQVERSNLLADLLQALERAAADDAGKPRPAGGIGGLWQVLREPETQAALRYAATTLGHFRALRSARG
jgi:uncharacterized protein YjgD (DUF1641 family)